MELPRNFESAPGQEPHRAFRNLCIEFKKILKSSKKVAELNRVMEKFIDEGKQMNWHAKTTGVYHKDEGKKLTEKVLSEYQRYVKDLEPYLNRADPSPVIEALILLEQFVSNFKVT